MIGLVVAIEDEVESLGIFRCRQQNRIEYLYPSFFLPRHPIAFQRHSVSLA